MNKYELEVEIELLDTRDVAEIAFIILANKLAKITGESQLKIQEATLKEATKLFRLSSPEMLECFISSNFPIIRVTGQINEN